MESQPTVVHFLKALADESRLRIVGLLATDERTVAEMAGLLQLTPPTVSHHLARLKEVGLVGMRAEGTSHIYRLEVETLHDIGRTLLAPDRMEALAADVEGLTWEQEVLRDFLDARGRLKTLPANRKKRSVVLAWLAAQFEPGRRYPEREVNDILHRYHEDSATLRRELIGADLLRRENGVYWRPAAS